MFLGLINLLPWQLFSQSEDSFGKLIGHVIDKTSQKSLPHVEVIIKSINRGDVTDRDGTFQIDNLPAGIYEVIFNLQGHKTLSRKEIVIKANETVEINEALVETVIEFEDLIVTAKRRIYLEQEVSQHVSVLTEQDIKNKNIYQTSEILKEEVGIFVQKTNQGGGSPIIRGLKANKLLLLVDGIRLNNATYRGGNLQYLNTVDSEALVKVEVVHGPHSVLYGSDALGGVINVITRNPTLNDNQGYMLKGSGSVTISSADHTQTGHINFMTANSKWGVLFEASYKSFGDITRGKKGGSTLMSRLQNDSRTQRILKQTQTPNAYDTIDLNSKILYNLSELEKVTVAYQLNRQNAVPRYDVFEVQKDSVHKFDPQERDLFYIKYQNRFSNKFYDSAKFTLSLHRQFERRIRQKFGSLNEFRDQFRTITTGLQLQFNKLLARKHNLAYGTEIYYDQIATKSDQKNTSTGTISNRTPIFPDGSYFIQFGFFAQNDFTLLPTWRLSVGGRFSAFKLKAPFKNVSAPENFGTIEQSPTALTGSLRSLVTITDGVYFVSNIAQGFRTPNLDDISKLGPGKGSSFFDIPSPQVMPEKTISIDAGFNFNFHNLKANAIGYYNYITDLLLRRPAKLNGSPFVIEEGDTLQVFRKENAGRAYITGFEIRANFMITENLNLVGNLSYTYGQNISENEPVSAIPPMHGFLGMRWVVQKFWAELTTRFTTEQDHLSPEDEQDLRIPEGGTPGWYTLNVRFGINLVDYISLRIAVANLLDRNYREHLSGFNAPGRNFIFGFQVKY